MSNVLADDKHYGLWRSGDGAMGMIAAGRIERRAGIRHEAISGYPQAEENRAGSSGCVGW